MAGRFRILGHSDNTVATVHTPTDDVHSDIQRSGLVVYTHPLEVGRPLIQFFADDEGKVDQNINASGAGTLTTVHNGTDTVAWTAVASVGTWDFASTAQANTGTKSIDATNTRNGDLAVITAPSPLNVGDFDTVVGYIYITSWPNSGNKDIQVQLDSGGAPVGTAVSLRGFIDTNVQDAWQVFEIPVVNFQVQVTQFDGIQLQIVDSGRGSAPTVYFDDLALVGVGTGTTKRFSIAPPSDETWIINRIKWTAVVNNSSIKPDEFFGIPELPSGYSLTFVNDQRTTLTLTAKNSFDIAQYPNTVLDIISGPASIFEVYFDIPEEQQVLIGQRGQRIDMLVRDDLSAMTKFRATAAGAIKTVV